MKKNILEKFKSLNVPSNYTLLICILVLDLEVLEPLDQQPNSI